MEVLAQIKGIKYTPFLCRRLHVYTFNDMREAFRKDASFILRINCENQLGISWWVSPKRTRSYPYARVYDTLSFLGKRVTIMPLIKDEGKDGDRDFLQWDTVSLMSLLGVYVIITYYANASPSQKYSNKITDQEFDLALVKDEIKKLLSYQSDALHWNLSQLDNVSKIGGKALSAYARIAKKLGIEMHSLESSKKRIGELIKGKDCFMTLSRNLAQKAQYRESLTRQPKENLTGTKSILTIKNYLGGFYYFTCDEVEIKSKEAYLVEGKHTKRAALPSLEDIKDGLLKMTLFTNLHDLKIDGLNYTAVPVLKLTTGAGFGLSSLTNSPINLLNDLKKEAQTNGFKVLINGEVLK